MFQTFSDERLTGTMEPGFLVVNNIIMTFALYRWIGKFFALQKGSAFQPYKMQICASFLEKISKYDISIPTSKAFFANVQNNFNLK